MGGSSPVNLAVRTSLTHQPRLPSGIQTDPVPSTVHILAHFNDDSMMMEQLLLRPGFTHRDGTIATPFLLGGISPQAS